MSVTAAGNYMYTLTLAYINSRFNILISLPYIQIPKTAHCSSLFLVKCIDQNLSHSLFYYYCNGGYSYSIYREKHSHRCNVPHLRVNALIIALVFQSH